MLKSHIIEEIKTDEKKKLILIWSGIIAFLVIANIIFWSFAIGSGAIWASVVAYLLIIANIVCLAIWISTFLVKYKKFDHNNIAICVYSGLIKHYLKIDGEIKDEIKTMYLFAPIKLTYKNHEIDVEVTISSGNFVKVRINGNLIK